MKLESKRAEVRAITGFPESRRGVVREAGLPTKLGFTAKGEQPRESMAGKPAESTSRMRIGSGDDAPAQNIAPVGCAESWRVRSFTAWRARQRSR
jgi:hypothetical protein